MAYFKMTKLALKWAITQTGDHPLSVRAPRRHRRARAGGWCSTKETCVYCNVCAKKCPTGAIVVQRAQKRWTIDRLLLHHLRLLRGGLPQEIPVVVHRPRRPFRHQRPRIPRRLTRRRGGKPRPAASSPLRVFGLAAPAG